jgi:hypothetical protein
VKLRASHSSSEDLYFHAYGNGEVVTKTCWLFTTRGRQRVGDVVYAETLEERDAGWLIGPYTREEVTKLLGRVWVVARRFGIRRGAKTCNIDDFRILVDSIWLFLVT